MAKTYKPKTPDFEVKHVSQVQVERNEDTIAVAYLTLNAIDTQINVKTVQVAALQAEITALGTERALVATEAAKVKLKVEEPEGA